MQQTNTRVLSNDLAVMLLERQAAFTAVAAALMSDAPSFEPFSQEPTTGNLIKTMSQILKTKEYLDKFNQTVPRLADFPPTPGIPSDKIGQEHLRRFTITLLESLLTHLKRGKLE